MVVFEEEKLKNVEIPTFVTKVNVTHIIEPNRIQVCPLISRKKRNDLHDKLKEVLKFELQSYSNKCTPKIGDDVLVSNEINRTNINLPDEICRGVVKDVSETARIFLLDHGIYVDVPIISTLKYTKSSIPIEEFTLTIQINVRPVDSKQRILDEWPNDAFEFVKSLIGKADKIYFTDLIKKKIYDGDLILVGEKKNLSLSEVLISTKLAILKPSVLKQKKNFKLLLPHQLFKPKESKEQKQNEHKDNSKSLLSHQLSKPKESIEQKQNEQKENSKSLLSQQLFKPKETKEQKQNDKIIKKEYTKFMPYHSCKQRGARINNETVIEVDRETGENLLIKSSIRCRSLRRLEDMKLTENLAKMVNDHNIRRLSCFQSNVWPAIKQGLDTVFVNPSSWRKLVGYAVPILKFVTDNEKIILESQKCCSITKPAVLILCSSVKKCENVAAKINNFLRLRKDIKAFAPHGDYSETELLTNIANKFQILVSTPSYLLELLFKYSSKLNFSELAFLVLDDADILMAKQLRDIITLVKSYKIINKHIVNSISNRSVQIIISSKSWTNGISSFIDKFMINPYICIGSFVETARDFGVQGKTIVCGKYQKKFLVAENLGKCYLTMRTMILCSNIQEAIDLNSFLANDSFKTVLIHENTLSTQIDEAKHNWANLEHGEYPVIICTDKVLSKLAISNVEFLISYSHSNISRIQFNNRFSVYANNWLAKMETKNKLLILFDELVQSANFKEILNILKKLDVDLPNDCHEIIYRVNFNEDLMKKDYPICDSLKYFGVCEKFSCPYRHRIFLDIDAPQTNICMNDKLKIQIIHIQDASHIIARVLEYTRTCSETKKAVTATLPHEILKLNLKMRQHYSNPKNLRIPDNVDVGKIYCFKNPKDQSYSRVKILNIVKIDFKTGKPRVVRLQSLDDGKIGEKIYADQLLEIPDEFLHYKCSILNIFLTDIAPANEEREWSVIDKNAVNKWLEINYQDGVSSIEGKALLHIGNSIWVDSLTVRTKLKGFPDLVSAPITDVLVKQGHATKNKKHLANLLKLYYTSV